MGLYFNEEPLINALQVETELEPIGYDQTYTRVDQHTTDSPKSHQCGFIAQAAHQIEEFERSSNRR